MKKHDETDHVEPAVSPPPLEDLADELWDSIHEKQTLAFVSEGMKAAQTVSYFFCCVRGRLKHARRVVATLEKFLAKYGEA